MNDKWETQVNADIRAGEPVSIHEYYATLKGMVAGVDKQCEAVRRYSDPDSRVGETWLEFSTNLRVALDDLERARAWTGIPPKVALREQLLDLVLEETLTTDELRRRVNAILEES